jgi:hypothetical protein
MHAVKGTITGSLTLKRADALAVGDIIPGGDAPKGHKILSVSRPRVDAMLGMVIIITVRQIPIDPDFEYYASRDYTFRPHDRIWVEA